MKEKPETVEVGQVWEYRWPDGWSRRYDVFDVDGDTVYFEQMMTRTLRDYGRARALLTDPFWVFVGVAVSDGRVG